MISSPSNIRSLARLGVVLGCAVVVSATLCYAADDAASQLVYPNGVAITPDGGLVITDIGAHQVLRLDGDGWLSIVAGTGDGGFGGDGGLATEARLHAPFDVAVGADGELIVADAYNHRVRRIDRNGRITTIAGNGRGEYSGDGGPAIEASLNGPQGAAVDAAGNLYIADTYNHVVRRVDSSGVITTFAGTAAGLAGDGGPAAKAQLSLPMAVAAAADGRVFICDAGNSRVRCVTPDGMIQTVIGFGPGAGTAGAGFQGDGGPAAKAKLFSPAGLCVGAAGELWIADSGNNRIRRIDYGVISTIAGTGAAGFGGDGGAAIEAALNTPQKIAVAENGTVFFTDRANHRVRKIGRDGVISTVVGDGEPASSLSLGE